VVAVVGVLEYVPETSNQSDPSFCVLSKSLPSQALPKAVSANDEAEVLLTIATVVPAETPEIVT
jgi:hypothetical protein